ncbi:MAG: hypothetical protein ACR2QE_05535 [Acidimicrobiales bacterium]
MTSATGAFWTVRMTSRWMVGFSIANMVAAVVMAVAWNLVVGLAFLAASGVVGMFSTALVQIDPEGLSVRFGLGWPHPRVRPERIEQASVVEVVPLRHGGWGYRGSLRLFDEAAVIIRGGEGIRLDLVDGKRFLVTVDDAATGVAFLNSVLR